jgi:WD40 repeat protein
LVWSVNFSPDGQTIASGGFDDTIKLWNFDLDKLMKQGCGFINGYLASHPDEEELRSICRQKFDPP